MIVAVNAARIRTGTSHRELAAKRRLPCTAGVAPRSIAAEGALR
jgi:hypothetical protein